MLKDLKLPRTMSIPGISDEGLKEQQTVNDLEVSTLSYTNVQYKMNLKPGQCAHLKHSVTVA
jgi:hypothetical protein